LGAVLNADGASIPNYQEAQGGKKLTAEEINMRLWEELYRDPFNEIRLLGFREQPMQRSSSLGILTPEKELQNRVAALPQDSALQTKLTDLGIGKYFVQAWEEIAGDNSQVFSKLLEKADRPLDDYYAAIARAIVAMSGLMYREFEWPLNPLLNEDLRNNAVDAIFQVLSRGEVSKGFVSNWFLKLALNLAPGLVTDPIKRQRGALTDGAYPFAGDIMVYLTKGKKIRDFIRRQIESAKPPVVLLAHSLGGISCVDLLIEEDLQDRVKLLITVGSQAPFLYEIDALSSIDFGKPLPEHFPQWLNIYDLKDFLSYIGGEVFPGKVRDVKVDNRQPFPESHSAYWANQQTWDAIKEFLP
jgi:hypothetical protein